MQMMQVSSCEIQRVMCDYSFLQFVGDHQIFIFSCLFLVCGCIALTAKIICGSKP